MKVLLVNGSPNREGCTYTALSEVAKTLNREGIDTEIFWIGNQTAGGCIICRQCGKLGKCSLEDGVNIFREKAYEADGFVFGSPVHFAALSGNMAGFMDRLFYSEMRGNASKAFRLKPAAGIVSARRAGTTAAFDQMNKYFTIQEMPVVSARYWNMVHGAKPEDVLKDEEGLFTMGELGRNMAYLLRCLQAGKEAGVVPPAQEDKKYTNFIR